MDRRKFNANLLTIAGTICLPNIVFANNTKDISDFINFLEKHGREDKVIYFSAYDIEVLSGSKLRYNKEGYLYLTIDDNDTRLMRFFKHKILWGFCPEVPSGWAHVFGREREKLRLKDVNYLKTLIHSESVRSVGNTTLRTSLVRV